MSFLLLIFYFIFSFLLYIIPLLFLFHSAAGTYNSFTGATVCPTCASATTTASTSCTVTPCSAGTYSSSGNAPCTDCAAGTAVSSGSATSCPACAAGTYQGSSGQFSCTACPQGKYSSSTGSTVCVDWCVSLFCAVEKEMRSSLTVSVTFCSAPGTYNSFTGATVCPACASASSAASTSCNQTPW